MAEAIGSLIGCSQRTILLITENFLQSDWCRLELQAALRESLVERQHKIIGVVLDPKCLLEMGAEMRALLSTGANVSLYSPASHQHQSQLVQLADARAGHQLADAPVCADDDASSVLAQRQLIATLTSQSGGNQQVSTQAAQLAGASRITFINYNERKFWPKLKQLMPAARPSAALPVALTLTTKNC